MQNLKIFMVLAAIAFVASIFFTGSNTRVHSDKPANLAEAIFVPEAQKPAPEPPQLIAASAVVFDPLGRSYIFEKQADEPVGIASISKVMTALIAYERTNNDDAVVVSRDAIRTEGSNGLIHGEHFRMENLLQMMLMESSNDAASAIAEHIGRIYGAETYTEAQDVFASLMNEKAKSLGMSTTHFQNATGLDIDAATPSNISTAHDIVKLALYSLRYPGIWETTDSPSGAIISQEGTMYKMQNINTLANELPGFVGGKTGFTDIAGGSLLVIMEIPIGSPKIVLALGSTHAGRFEDVQKLINWLEASLSSSL
ncbi:MAG: hypothetical protein A3C84_02205 [Candidatus Ryanbacteria bacterium RIFCSPHIGHO2_02_FULL_48_12]|uniref:Peptidase S11 D-alanyl-D-alanine carboxypeptidase A N-terminal domain-containing protein n=1 Tax=Candidatus Ryanbacteria bacterium RIFCSPHIGHO2_01_FULL_48_27 TaxID=1802115 RepID=A0A1G2G350_9BACT|nr:MAG: hypothetical protein A2756_04635 [Candidatus Ryanbacteria bacterium RIFCSPHIGHO2_01_FULL_48_27]OGZ49265.1 MAG: hypothetical protein A3C84_02205 [Candidatus Ryanbacteria bacterium RIFCSPHIGHO2_02_FULL_48_12]